MLVQQKFLRLQGHLSSLWDRFLNVETLSDLVAILIILIISRTPESNDGKFITPNNKWKNVRARFQMFIKAPLLLWVNSFFIYFFLSSNIGPEPVCPSRETACTDLEGERGVGGCWGSRSRRHPRGQTLLRLLQSQGDGTEASSNFQSTLLIWSHRTLEHERFWSLSDFCHFVSED